MGGKAAEHVTWHLGDWIKWSLFNARAEWEATLTCLVLSGWLEFPTDGFLIRVPGNIKKARNR